MRVPRFLAGWLGVAVLCAAPSSAAFEVRLVLPDGAPAAGYSVSVPGQGLAAVADAAGRVRLDPAPRPPFALVGTSPGGAVVRSAEIASLPGPAAGVEGEAGVSDLAVVPVTVEALTVVPDVAPGLDLLPANAAATIAADGFAARPVPKVALALESVAGAGKLDGGADGVPSLRGLARGRTLVLVDGARVSAERRAGPSATFLDPASLAALEVARGPGSVVYGSDAFGGVLNAVTRDPEPGRVRVGFELENFSQGLRETGGYASAGGDVGRGAFFVDLHASEADDWIDGHGDVVPSSGFASRGGSLRWLQDAGAGRLRASVGIDRGEDVDKPAIDSLANSASYPLERSERFQLGWTGAGPGSWSSVESMFSFGGYRLVLDRERRPAPGTTRRFDTSDVDAKDAQWRSVATREAGGGRLRVGVDLYARFDLHAIFDRTTYDAADRETSFTRTIAIDDAHQETEAAFVTWTRPLGERFTLDVGSRADFVQTTNSGGTLGDRSEDAEALSGSVALTAALAPGWQLTGQLARGFRVPTLSDRYFVGPSGRGSVIGNPELEPEESLQADLALRFARGRTSAALYAYRYAIDDLVERYADGADFRFRNRGEAVLRGVEVEARADFGERWSGDLGFAWAEGEADGSDPLADVAAPNGWIGARFAAGALELHGRLTVVGAKDDPGPAELARDGYELVDLGGAWRFGEALALRLLVRNVADAYVLGAADELTAPSPGRTVQLSLSGRY